MTRKMSNLEARRAACVLSAQLLFRDMEDGNGRLMEWTQDLAFDNRVRVLDAVYSLVEELAIRGRIKEKKCTDESAAQE